MQVVLHNETSYLLTEESMSSTVVHRRMPVHRSLLEMTLSS